MIKKILFISFVLIVSFASSFKLAAADVSVLRGTDGVMYLSTQINPSDAKTKQTTEQTVSQQNTENSAIATSSAKAKLTISPLQLGVTNITVPEGFYTNISLLLNQLLRVIFLVSTLLTFAYLISGGFDWITSGGDKGKVQQASSKLLAAVIGLVLVSASYAILSIVLQFLGFSSLEHVFDSVQLPH